MPDLIGLGHGLGGRFLQVPYHFYQPRINISAKPELLTLYQHINFLGILLKCRFCFSRSAAEPQILHNNSKVILGCYIQTTPRSKACQTVRRQKEKKFWLTTQTLLVPLEKALQWKQSETGDTSENAFGDHAGRVDR